MTEENTEALVEGMKSEESFDLLAAVADVAYPTGEATIYLNGALAHEYNELRGELDVLKADEHQGISDPDQLALQERIDAVREEIRKSALTFHMRGVAPAVRKAISAKARATFKTPKNADEEAKQEIWMEENAWITNELVRHSIVKVVNAKGQTATKGYTNEDIQKLADTLIASEFAKLDSLCASLTTASNLFSETLDADFLPKPSADQ